MIWIVVLVMVVVVGLVLAAVAFNRLRTQDVSAQEALGGIDVQLTRRADLVPNLVETVKGYAAHERAVFDEVTQARAQVASATGAGATVEQRAAAEAALQRGILHINAVAEAYPDLKASQGFISLQEQLASTEDQLAFARQYYNDSVSTLNTSLATIPWMWMAGPAGVRPRAFYQAAEGQEPPPQVRF
ncbi:LemA family protein [Longivirga aurantiaca]|uniref:LemA family protein n=1 Tax=Longivirga aurantiaca TaxID=1837743 RepID=A0ABW1SWU6_9ACTN